eukprot:288378_1
MTPFRLDDISYNSVIVHIISHGSADSFVTSDFKIIENEFVRHELVTAAEEAQNLHLVKLFFHHGCRGDADYRKVQIPECVNDIDMDDAKEEEEVHHINYQSRAVFDIAGSRSDSVHQHEKYHMIPTV